MELRPVTCCTVQVAVWVPFNGAADQASVFPRLKTSCSGLWLKSSDAGVLCIDARQQGAPLLSVKLKNQQQVLACPITWQALHCTTLCPDHSGGTRCWVLFLCVSTASKVRRRQQLRWQFLQHPGCSYRHSVMQQPGLACHKQGVQCQPAC